VARLYRKRWTLELAIKRWKSLLDVAALRARSGGRLAEVWVHGKLLYAVMVEQRARRRLGDELDAFGWYASGELVAWVETDQG
jgi:hypothetical protein